ncbi:MAG: D-2-hydroxyacid dehydrogenase family protein, partial [Dehalococcoidia bacterium]
MVRIAVLDDFTGVAKEAADWDSIPDAEVVFFNDHLTEPEALVERLKDFEVIQVMRERTNLHADVLDRLPRLKMISSTGGRHPHIDLEAAER